MLSGEFVSLPIQSIQPRDEDVRSELDPGKVEELAQSIRRKGLMHPIVITREQTLVAGGRRLAACKSIGLTHIQCQYVDTLEEAALLEIELEENIKRVDLPWQDQCTAIRKLHQLRVDMHGPSWTIDNTAEESGFSHGFVSERLAVAEKIAAGDERVLASKGYSVAKNITKRINERAKSDELQSITMPVADTGSPILTADFATWAEEYTGPPFNFIHCDFPYGIGVDKFQQASAETRGGYDDSFESYVNLIKVLETHKDKLMGQSCHVMFWFAMRHYAWTLDRLQSIGLWVDFQPLIWFKNDNSGALPDPERGPRRVYETAFWCSYGDRKILSGKANTFAAPITRLAEHASEKNVQMLQHFLSMAVDGTTRFLDPTCGSGSALRAAHNLNAGSVLGLELNPQYADDARRIWGDRK
jgi:ParB/RepB/Spo0J family partition protein